LSQISAAIGSLVVPALAGILVLSVQIQGIIIIDFSTYLFSLLTLLIVKIPSPAINGNTGNDSQLKGFTTIYHDLQYSWQYMISHPSILSLTFYFTAVNFFLAIISLLLVPMLLGFSNSSTAGSIMSIGGIGALFGSILLGFVSGPKNRLTKMIFFGLCLGICVVFAGLRPSIYLVTIAIFCGMLSFTMLSGISEILLVSIIPVEMQGRLFGLQSMIVSSSIPLAYLGVGPLIDLVFEPLLSPRGLLADNIGRIIGVGQGRGIALFLVVLGALQIIATFCAYQYRPLRQLDQSNSLNSFEAKS
jgi:MFS transporter, DHA3 family, macrolide efflux protein